MSSKRERYEHRCLLAEADAGQLHGGPERVEGPGGDDHQDRLVFHVVVERSPAPRRPDIQRELAKPITGFELLRVALGKLASNRFDRVGHDGSLAAASDGEATRLPSRFESGLGGARA